MAGGIARWGALGLGFAGGAALIAGGLLFVGQAGARADLEAFARDAAFGADPATVVVRRVAEQDAAAGPVPDGALLGASALAHIVLAERTGGQAGPDLAAARARLMQEARIAPRNPYLWTQLAAIELADGAPAARVGELLAHSFALGPNAVAAWPARVAIGFRIWAEAPDDLRARILAEALRMWRKSGDRNWDRRNMQQRLARLAMDAGLTDMVTRALAETPEDLARWTYLLGEEAARL